MDLANLVKRRSYVQKGSITDNENGLGGRSFQSGKFFWSGQKKWSKIALG